MRLLQYLSDVSAGFPFYGVHAPAPLGSVAVSLDRDFFSTIEDRNMMDKVIMLRRLGQYEKAIQLISKLIKQNHETDFLFLELTHNYYLTGNISLARESLRQVADQQSEICTYFRSIIFNSFEKNMCSLNVLLNNPLLFSRSSKIFKIDINDREFFNEIKSIENCKKVLILLTAIESAALSKGGMEKMFCDYGDLIRKYLTNNHKFLDKLIETIGFDDAHEYLKNGNILTPSPDMIYSVFSLLPEYKSLFDPRLVVHGSSFLDIERSDIMRRVFLTDNLIRDRNTSDNATRFYSLNLKGDSVFANIEERAALLLQKYILNNEQFKDFLNRNAINLEHADIWYDMSITYGLSKIDDHIHTAAPGNTYLATLVWYANVPTGLMEHEGNINVNTGGQQARSISIVPKTNDYVIFPPWFKHGTTPTDSLEPRVTYNFDLFVKLSTVN